MRTPATPGEALPKPRLAYTHSIKKRLLVRQVEREACRAEVAPFLLATLSEMPALWRSGLRVMGLRDQRLSRARIADVLAAHPDPVPASEAELHAAACEGRSWLQLALLERFGVVPYHQLRWLGRW